MNTSTLTLNGEKFLTRKDVMELFDISGVTLWTWVKKGVIRQHHIGKFVYYLEEEISEDIKRSGAVIRRSHKEKI
jgi:predicted DNA-binding transcriptional regulator AlpA